MLDTDSLSFLDEEPQKSRKSIGRPANRHRDESPDADPLSFLDEESSKARKPVRKVVKRSRAESSGADPLSFLDEPTDEESPSSQAESTPTEPSFLNKVSNFFFGDKGESDPLAFLEEPQEPEHWYDKFIPKPFKKDEKLLDIYRVEEKTPEELKAMPFEEKMQYMEDMKRMKEMQQSRGFTKGALSGFSFGASEHIPALKPDEEDLLVGLGDVVGSYLPITGLYNFIGAPIVNFASKSPVARKGLESLARMTGFGLTGAAHKGAKDLVKGEVPTVEELAKEGAVWAAIDAGLQSIGVGIAFTESVNRIAKAEGVTAKEVLGKLWNSTKNYVKAKFGRSVKGEVLPEDAQVLLQEAKKAEAAIPKEGEIEVRPVEKAITQPKETKPTVIPSEQLESDLSQAKNELVELEKLQGKGATNEKSELIQKINKLEFEKHNQAKLIQKINEIEQEKHNLDKESSKQEPSIPENAVLTKPESISIGVRGGKGAATVPVAKVGEEGKEYFSHEEIPVTKEERELIDASNAWSTAGDQKESSELAQQAREMIFNRLKENVSDVTKEAPQETFTTSKGSIYQINEDGSTTRTKASRPEHLGEEGIQPKSEKTWYVTPEESIKLGEFQTKGEGKKIVELPNGQLGVQYLTGKDAGKIEKRTLVDFSNKPAEGLIPVEAWNEGEKIHFGNQIVKIEKPKKVERNVESALQSKVAEKAAPEAVEELPKKPTKVPPRGTKPLQPVKGQKQAKARSKIIDLFRKAFTDPIRLGKIGQRKAAGIHKLWPKVTRLLKANDVETAAHEIGHNLHTTLYGGNAKTAQEQFKNIESALRPYLDELKPLAHYEPWGMEGFAEFTRLYVTNPDVAEELAPNFYYKFTTDLDAQYPELKNALLEARDYYDQYLQGTPQSRIRAQTSYGSDKGKLANIIESVKKYLNLDYLQRQLLDDVYPAKRLVAEAFGIPISEVENLKDERNLYRALRVLKGAVGKGDVFVLHETFNAKTLDKINGSLRDILKQLPNEESYREFNDYLIARRSLEKTAQNIETGINAGDAVAVEADLRPKYGKLAQELDKYNDSLLNYAKDSGLLSGEQYKAIKENNVLYTPFQRVMEPEKGGIASGGGRIQAGKPIKRMKGSTRDIIAPVESIIKNTYAIILNAEKNLAGQVLAKIAKMKNMGGYVEKVPTPIKLKGKVEGEQVARELAKRFEQEGLSDLIEYDSKGKPVLREDIADAIPEVFLRFGAGQYPAGENIISVYAAGKPQYFEVSPELFEMWNKGIGPYEAGLITKILRFPAKTLRAGAIFNPRFIQKNIIRDTWGSWLFTKYGKSIKDPVGLFIDTLYSPLAMLATSAGKGKLYVEWLKSGGGMSTMQSLHRDAITKKLSEVRGQWQGVRPLHWLKKAAEISEEANRLSEFGKALEVEGKTRLGREIAAFAARDLSIDFAKIGLQTKALNQIVPFWNATVQGGDKFLRTLANPEDRKNFLPRVIGFIVLPSLMLAWLNKDDENVKEFQEQEKDFNFIVPVNGEYLKIPVPFETGVIAHGLTQRMFNYFIKKDPEAFEKFMGSVMDAMLPGFIPTAGLPFLETWANKSFFTGGRIIPRAQEDLIARYQYKNNTSSTARLIGRAMTYMLGQETRSKAASPAIIDHFINSWTGGLGRLMTAITDASLESAGLGDKIPGPKQAITERFGLDAFTARFPRASTRSIEKFYDNYADATSRQKSFKYAEKMEADTPEALEGSYQRFDKIYDYNTLKHAYKAIQKCQKEINGIWIDPSISPELKRQFIDDLYMQMIEFARAANEEIKRHRLAQ